MGRNIVTVQLIFAMVHGMYEPLGTPPMVQYAHVNRSTTICLLFSYELQKSHIALQTKCTLYVQTHRIYLEPKIRAGEENQIFSQLQRDNGEHYQDKR